MAGSTQHAPLRATGKRREDGALAARVDGQTAAPTPTDAEAPARDASPTTDAATRSDGATFEDPWAGMCTPGETGTYQTRPRCSDPQQAAILDAGVGPKNTVVLTIDSLAIDPPMRAGKPFTFSIEGGTTGADGMNIELWGADDACGTTNLEKLTALQLTVGIACDTFTPKRSHAHMLLVIRSNEGHITKVHAVCADGQCVENMATKREWPGET